MVSTVPVNSFKTSIHPTLIGATNQKWSTAHFQRRCHRHRTNNRERKTRSHCPPLGSIHEVCNIVERVHANCLKLFPALRSRCGLSQQPFFARTEPNQHSNWEADHPHLNPPYAKRVQLRDYIEIYAVQTIRYYSRTTEGTTVHNCTRFLLRLLFLNFSSEHTRASIISRGGKDMDWLMDAGCVVHVTFPKHGRLNLIVFP